MSSSVSNFLSVRPQKDSLHVGLKNSWVFDNVSILEKATASVVSTDGKDVIFHCGGLKKIDIAGAWVLYDRSQQLAELGIKSDFIGFKAAHFKFLQNIIDMAAVREFDEDGLEPQRKPWLTTSLENLGKSTSSSFEEVGFISNSIVDGMRRPIKLILGETIKQVYETGVQAIPIVMVITFLIGIVLAYQASGQLEQFGAKIFVVDLVSISILREMGVLLAAVMVAGRSGSAFAAALGTMKLNEEIDALRVMGLNPNQVLILPRVIGMIIALPMVTIFADIAGLAGGAMIAIGTLDINSQQFIERVSYSTDLNDLMVGLVKAPFFAFLIAVTSTLRGMQVEHSAEELGKKTTVAVVQSIFLILLADAYFTMIFARLGI
ncbi:MAG: phospholipid/cholesterol/gamma-HCH transport system permease protein [Lysobacterales bacterium]|jgi:phospholipid/cholesterol/gamma-HCH transport system permease protein